MNTIVSDIAPSAGFQINMAPTTMDKIAVSNVHKNAGTSRVANAATTPTKPLIRSNRRHKCRPQ